MLVTAEEVWTNLLTIFFMNSYSWTHQCLLTSKDLYYEYGLKDLLGAMVDKDRWRETVNSVLLTHDDDDDNNDDDDGLDYK